MKQSSIVRAGLGLAALVPALASAQNNLQIYGIVDTGVEFARATAGTGVPANRSTAVASGSLSASRLGFRGTEDLGGGLRSGFLLEHGFDADTGANTGLIFWGRESWVSIGSREWGDLRLGYNYTPAFWVVLRADNNRLGLYGNGGNYAQIGAVGNLRAANALNYISPSRGGFTVRLAYSLGNENTAPPKDQGRMKAAALEYQAGSLYLGAFHQRRKDTLTATGTFTEDSRYSGVGANVDVGPVQLGGGVTRYDPAGPDTATAGELSSWWLGAQTTFGATTVGIQLGEIRRDAPAGVQPRARLASLNALYALSKRTTLYASLGRMDNNATSRLPLQASSRTVGVSVGPGTDTNGLAMGVRHTF